MVSTAEANFLIEYYLMHENTGINPRIFHSEELSDIVSRRIGKKVYIDVLDFSVSKYKSHKGPKAEEALLYILAHGGGTALLITSGSAKEAFEMASRNYPNTSVASFMDGSKMDSREAIDIRPNNYGGDSICIRLPDRWFTRDTLEGFWSDLIEGDDSRFPEVADYMGAPNYSRLVDFVNKKGHDRAFDFTNISDHSVPNPYYHSHGDMFIKAFKEYGLIMDQIGIGEGFSAMLEAMKRVYGDCAQLLGVTSYANPLSVEQAQESIAHKLDTPRLGAEHIKLIGDSYGLRGQGRIVKFKGVSDEEIGWAYEVMSRISEPDFETTPTGSSSLGALRNARGVIDGIEIPGTYFSDLYNGTKVIEPVVLKEGSRILVTNTCGKC